MIDAICSSGKIIFGDASSLQAPREQINTRERQIVLHRLVTEHRGNILAAEEITSLSEGNLGFEKQ